MAVIAVRGDAFVTLVRRGFETDNDRFLTNIKMAKAADEAHAIELADLFFETADQ